MKYTVLSDKGLKRSRNEDSAAYSVRALDSSLAVIADGMGGHNAGELASALAVEGMRSAYERADLAVLSDAVSCRRWMLDAFRAINSAIYRRSLESAECNGMGTTLVAALFLPRRVLIGHVGDSRAYVYSAGRLEQVTRDHSYVNVLIETGEISEREAVGHPQRNMLMKAVGTAPGLDADLTELPWLGGATMLLCSDGLSNKVEAARIERILADRSLTIEEQGNALLQAANDGGGEDNITLILLRGEEDRP